MFVRTLGASANIIAKSVPNARMSRLSPSHWQNWQTCHWPRYVEGHGFINRQHTIHRTMCQLKSYSPLHFVIQKTPTKIHKTEKHGVIKWQLRHEKGTREAPFCKLTYYISCGFATKNAVNTRAKGGNRRCKRRSLASQFATFCTLKSRKILHTQAFLQHKTLV